MHQWQYNHYFLKNCLITSTSNILKINSRFSFNFKPSSNTKFAYIEVYMAYINSSEYN